MNIEYSSALKEYMDLKQKHDIVIELAECNNSEIEVAELHVFLTNSKNADFFIQKKGYGVFTTEYGRVLFPRIKLQLDETIFFDVRKVLCFHILKYKGIKL